MYHLRLLGKAPAISAANGVVHRREYVRPKAPAATSPHNGFKRWKVHLLMDRAGHATTDPWPANISFDSTAALATEPTERFLALRLRETTRRTRVRPDVADRLRVKS